nr:MAG TPA: repressor domain protein [Caudoviricetes sp.]
MKKHVDEEDKQNRQNASFESPRGLIVINESGLYSLILSSKLPKAKEFKRWVTAEVLPSIRKTGAYSAPQYDERLYNLEKEKTDVKRGELLLSMADKTLSPRYKEILLSYSARFISGENILPLPKAEENTWSATEVAEKLGISSAMKVGMLANQIGIKPDKSNNEMENEYSVYVLDKAKHTNKEVYSLRYKETSFFLLSNAWEEELEAKRSAEEKRREEQARRKEEKRKRRETAKKNKEKR